MKEAEQDIKLKQWKHQVNVLTTASYQVRFGALLYNLLIFYILVFSPTGSPQQVDNMAPMPVNIRKRNPIKCLLQEHNK